MQSFDGFKSFGPNHDLVVLITSVETACSQTQETCDYAPVKVQTIHLHKKYILSLTSTREQELICDKTPALFNTWPTVCRLNMRK